MGIPQTDSTHKIRKRNFTCFSKKKKKKNYFYFMWYAQKNY